MFERVLIANRGEVAVRIIRACRELGVETVAVYSTADRESLHVRLADRAVHIGPPLPADSYLRIPSLVAAATTTECDAVHPGWGFLAENAAFALACEDNDLVFIGPRAETIETMGDKIAAKEAMAEAGVPLVPGSDGAVDLDQAREVAAEVGFPVLLKASAGGGGRGMRLVESADELDAAYRTASSEAQSAFGDGSLYVEKAVVGARHVEIQVLGDGEGAVLTLGERDCSIQRRHQKLVEESPSPAVTPEIRAEMEGAAHRACEALRYRGAGTIEFLLDADGRFYFIEMNTRLQVEHPVTELVTGIDLAHAQLAVAAGEGLPARGPRGPARPRDRVSDQRRGPGRGLPAGARPRIPLPAAARPGRARGHTRGGGLCDPALLRLPDREGDRLGRGPRGRDRPRPARALRARARRRPDHARARARHRLQRGVRERRLHDVLPRRRGSVARVSSRRSGMTTGRRAARRAALFVLYQWDVTGQPLASLYEGELDPYTQELAEGVAAETQELDATIGEASSAWPPERLGALERNILRIALYELDRDEVPLEVSIDEAVRLARRYSSEDAAKLVNGILGKVAKEAKR